MPAAAVIPAPIAYIKVVAVKKLVVGFLEVSTGPRPIGRVYLCGASILTGRRAWRASVGSWIRVIYCEKIRVFKAGICLEYISME